MIVLILVIVLLCYLFGNRKAKSIVPVEVQQPLELQLQGISIKD